VSQERLSGIGVAKPRTRRFIIVPPGGDNHTVLSETGQALVEAMLFAELERDCSRKSFDFAMILQGRGFPVDKR